MSNIVFFIAAANTSCAINVRVPRPLLSQNDSAFSVVEALKRLIKRQLMQKKHHFSL